MQHSKSIMNNAPLEMSKYVVKYLHLTHEVVNEFQNQKKYDRDDLLQIGVIGLIKSYRAENQEDVEESKKYIRDEINKFFDWDAKNNSLSERYY